MDQGLNVGLSEDYIGTSIPQGSGVDIGSYEFTSGDNTPPHGPTGLRVE